MKHCKDTLFDNIRGTLQFNVITPFIILLYCRL